mmetsp:Transcript_10001/g.12480  ORF Transcript_10001/g.12480 Transcript_10001/m.12480 type:complete len:140 (-) Transcript_10001:1004-1423(-)
MKKTIREKKFDVFDANENELMKNSNVLSRSAFQSQVPKFRSFFAESVYKLIVQNQNQNQTENQLTKPFYREYRANFEYDVESLEANQLPRIRTEKLSAVEFAFTKCVHLNDDIVSVYIISMRMHIIILQICKFNSNTHC